MQLCLAIDLIIVFCVEVLYRVVVGLALELLHHTHETVRHQEAVWQDEILCLARLQHFCPPTHIILLHLFSLLFRDMILVEHFLRLQVNDAHGRVNDHEVVVSIVKDLCVLGACQPCFFFVFVEHIL